MQWKRFGRCLVCLLVVVALLINMVPQKAEALALDTGTAVLVTVAAPIVVSSVLIGLGVNAGVLTVDFTSIVDLCVAYLQDIGLCQDFSIDILGWQVEGTSLFGITPRIIEAIRDWLFEEEVVSFSSQTSYDSVGFSVADSTSDPSAAAFWGQINLFSLLNADPSGYLIMGVNSGIYLGLHVDDSRGFIGCVGLPSILPYTNISFPVGCFVENFSSAPSYSDYFVCFPNYDLAYSYCIAENRYVYFLTQDSYLDVSSSVFTIRDLGYLDVNGTVSYGKSLGFYTTKNSNSSTQIHSSYDIYPSSSVGISVSSDYDISFGEIAPSDTAIDEGYSTWYGNAISVPGSLIGSDDESVVIYPSAIAPTQQETMLMTQEQIWAGESTYVDTSTDTGTDTDTGVSTGTFADTLVGDFLISLGEIIMTPFEWLLEGVKAIFVPSEDFLSAKVEALRKNFLFADSIITAWESLRSAFTEFETEPPVIYMELSNSESDIDYGSRAIALDLTWYERYKPTVDTLLSSLLWIWFVWRVFRKLPGIISGMPGDTPDVPVSDGHFYGYAEGRKRLPGGSIKRR